MPAVSGSPHPCGVRHGQRPGPPELQEAHVGGFLRLSSSVFAIFFLQPSFPKNSAPRVRKISLTATATCSRLADSALAKFFLKLFLKPLCWTLANGHKCWQIMLTNFANQVCQSRPSIAASSRRRGGSRRTAAARREQREENSEPQPQVAVSAATCHRAAGIPSRRSSPVEN